MLSRSLEKGMYLLPASIVVANPRAYLGLSASGTGIGPGSAEDTAGRTRYGTGTFVVPVVGADVAEADWHQMAIDIPVDGLGKRNDVSPSKTGSSKLSKAKKGRQLSLRPDHMF